MARCKFFVYLTLVFDLITKCPSGQQSSSGVVLQVSTTAGKFSVGRDGDVGGNEILPAGLLAPLGSWRDSVSAKHISHGLIGDGMAGIGHSSDNAVSPTGVLPDEADNERLRCGR